MIEFNKVMLLGRLCRDPEMRYVGETQKTSMRLATSREWKNRDGEKQKQTCYVDVIAWSKLGEVCKRYLAKGSQVFVEGRLDYQEWEKDGQRRSKHEVVAENVQFMDTKKDGEDRREERGGYQGRDSSSGADRYGNTGGGSDADIPF